MPEVTFKDLFDSLKIPVIVCKKAESLPVVFMNASARLVVRPSLTIRKLKGVNEIGDLSSYLHFAEESDFDGVKKQILNVGTILGFRANIVTFEGETIPATLISNSVVVRGVEHAIIYITCAEKDAFQESGATGDLLSRILHEAYHEKDLDETIQTIIALAGRHTNVSRVYIFEDISPELTRNTYEWCAPGVTSAIDLLQNLRKDAYNYDVIISSSMYIFDDTRTLPEHDRAILYDMQGIKSIAIFALYHRNKPLGYIGFDDTVKYRKWTRDEIKVLEGIASVVSTLISRRNAEKKLRDGREVMQTITDNLEDLIFVTDLETFELKFVSKSLCRAQGMTPEELLGKRCWEVLHFGQTGPCSFCPLPHIYGKEGEPAKESHVWEFQNDINGKWYLIKDNIIKWTDGKLVHLETAVDITYQKQYEEQLKFSASTDAMTTVYNRDWGYNKLKAIASGDDDGPAGPKSLCFIDIDGLKSVNDRFGHAVGDDMIVNTIKTIFACVRKEDFMCRWGGDEFILVLYCDLSTARKVMDKIAFAIDHFNQTSGKEYRLSISHGVVEIPASGDVDVDELIQRADRLMYQHKNDRKTNRSRRITRIIR